MSLKSGRMAPGSQAGSTGTRAALVAALGAVTGVSATNQAPDVATAGAAWPRWVQTTYSGSLSDPAEDVYDVYVILPADYAEHTTDEGDAMRDRVEPVLWAVSTVAYCEPLAVQFSDSQTMPGLRFRVTVL